MNESSKRNGHTNAIKLTAALASNSNAALRIQAITCAEKAQGKQKATHPYNIDKLVPRSSWTLVRACFSKTSLRQERSAIQLDDERLRDYLKSGHIALRP